jgi:hypothetical protein
MTTANTIQPVPVDKGCAAQTVAALLKPVALTASVMGVWALASGLSWTAGFVIPSGLFSHWQVWLGAAAFLQVMLRGAK